MLILAITYAFLISSDFAAEYHTTMTAWSGYGDIGGTINPNINFTGVSGNWIVEHAFYSSSQRVASQWIGIGGYSGGDLIQIGTFSNYSGGAQYSAWYEVVPNFLLGAKFIHISINVKFHNTVVLL